MTWHPVRFMIRNVKTSIHEPNNMKQDKMTSWNEVRATSENISDIKLDILDYNNECSTEQQQILSNDNRKTTKLVIVPIKVK